MNVDLLALLTIAGTALILFLAHITVGMATDLGADPGRAKLAGIAFPLWLPALLVTRLVLYGLGLTPRKLF